MGKCPAKCHSCSCPCKELCHQCSPVIRVQIVVLVLGLVIITLGLFSHRQSIWENEVPTYLGGSEKFHELCGTNDTVQDLPITSKEECPGIGMEHYFLFVVITCFVSSLIITIASTLLDLHCSVIKIIIEAYHIIAAFFLMTAAIVYIVSAVLINNIYGKLEKQLNSDDFRLRYGEKIAAGSLTCVQAILYLVLALLIKKQHRQ